MKIVMYDFKTSADERGALSAVEGGKDIPFEIKRVYYIYSTKPEVRRGCHAHKSLKQVLVCMKGSCKILLDDGKERQEIRMDMPGKGLFIGEMVWREMYDFSPDCVLVVLASDHYDENDYIRDHVDFIKAAGHSRDHSP
ncbi:MAG: FdtA/QdtA family cupin domain-containing protein [Dehalococcoidia bacterium]|nr:FdtA/QdtA family cupin domain-containing protein [Dehalococcoidia bacterium]